MILSPPPTHPPPIRTQTHSPPSFHLLCLLLCHTQVESCCGAAGSGPHPPLGPGGGHVGAGALAFSSHMHEAHSCTHTCLRHIHVHTQHTGTRACRQCPVMPSNPRCPDNRTPYLCRHNFIGPLRLFHPCALNPAPLRCFYHTMATPRSTRQSARRALWWLAPSRSGS